MWLNPYEDIWTIVLEMIFISFLMKSLVYEVKFLCHVCTEGSGLTGRMRPLKSVLPFISFWVVVEWFHLLFASFVIGAWAYVVASMWQVADSLQGFARGKGSSE